MKQMMSSWLKRAECYSFWDVEDADGGKIPLISFSIDMWTLENRPACYYAYNDTNRWRSLHFRILISRRLFAITIPYKRLPDYVPTGKAMLRTRRVQAEHEAKRAAQKV